jgi:hypothetical protein
MFLNASIYNPTLSPLPSDPHCIERIGRTQRVIFDEEKQLASLSTRHFMQRVEHRLDALHRGGEPSLF